MGDSRRPHHESDGEPRSEGQNRPLYVISSACVSYPISRLRTPVSDSASEVVATPVTLLPRSAPRKARTHIETRQKTRLWWRWMRQGGGNLPCSLFALSVSHSQSHFHLYRAHPPGFIVSYLLTALSRTANILPPPDDLTLPIVKLLTHPSYRTYQDQTASLSLCANLYVNFLPPAWGAPTPPTPPPPATPATPNGENAEAEPRTDFKEKNEWKRRIKMYSTSLPLSTEN